jgi:hypothetical protein
MRRLLILVMVLIAASVRAESLPSCETLVASIAGSFEVAHEVVLAVTVWTGSRELAHEATHLRRTSTGDFESTTIAQRGIRRPGGAGDATGTPAAGGFDLPCAGHELVSLPSGEVELRLNDPDSEGMVRDWVLRFGAAPHGWVPVTISIPFEVRVLLLPVRGRFVSEFSGWVFADGVP